MRTKLLSFIIWFVTNHCIESASAQELQARVRINSNKVYSAIVKKTLHTLQSQLTDFINNTKWTNDVFTTSEKIDCNFLLTLDNTASNDPNVYTAQLIVQAVRPVFNTTYQSVLLNYLDNNIAFQYVEFQPLEFNIDRVQGTNANTANLAAVFAYYAYIILGLDYDSFSIKGGTPYFQKALYIVNNAPESSIISGWKSFDGQRTRYWLARHVNDSRLEPMREAIYSYYRTGLDLLYENPTTSKVGILRALSKLQVCSQDNPNTMLFDFFTQNRSDEWIGLYKDTKPNIRNIALDLFVKLDPSSTRLYQKELQ